MNFLRRLPRQLWHLFVDDGQSVAILLCWVLVACGLLPRFALGVWSGPILFAGIAAITFGSLRPRG
ncbi:hypothetical protein [Lichenicoccus roseus]|uniref:Uncharacterized protein n=1 Tax=Lichenicoccus roseus TaxID=2683649 RepID=A0A5R9JAE0_9PROT|nr:hypothetical protein [Lichenicoccus roseus]TLU74545.1 hypothetical protein FE263_05080 [Lichenicoccus roseus]